ncbi:MAG: methionine synthase [Acidobacteria bacterium]|nr:MAG: methionine synthase [Acidobacteriota bacterium]
MLDAQARRVALYAALRQRILVLDGAMGTMLQQRQLTAADFGGPALEGCNENLVRTRPDVLLDIHREYLDAGADIIETDSFGSTSIVLGEYGLQAHAREISRIAAQLARQAADAASTPARPRWVAGSMGPTTKAITVTGGVTFEQLRAAFREQAEGLVEGGADLLLVETCQDTRNIKAALLGIEDAGQALGVKIPVMVSGTIEAMGTMLAGQSAEALWVSLEHADLLSIGLNCATGPEFMTDHVRTLHTLSHRYISCYPNAGLPNEEGKYRETPESLAHQMQRFVQHGWVNLIGGCCGTTPAHIAALAAMAAGQTPRLPPAPSPRAFFSGIETVEADDATRPLIIGERTNIVGSRLFKRLVAEEKWEEASEIARRQVKNGAHIIDVCLQSTEREEIGDIPPFYEKLIRKIKVPVMIDTTDARAVELSLTYCQGKGLINSINLEDGEEKFERICPLARRYGAALVVGCIDEDKLQAQAFTRERKLAIAQRSVALLTEKYGIPAHNIAIDPLVFPCATGDENYIGGAVETIEGVRLVKENLPGVKTVLGISNVSFGLPAAAREVVNSVFLYHCTKAGLDLAIVNAEKLERFASLPAEERALAEALLFNAPVESVAPGAPADWRQQTKQQRARLNQHHIAAIAEHFRAPRASKAAAVESLPLDERLGRYIIEGTKDGLVADLERKRAEGATPLEIINGPLMTGMAEVGRLFNNNELIVAEVLQSAEAMKAAVTHLEQFMEKSESATKGSIILATVKGDVHDIGKNLVDIILSNNGYRVVNLGIKIPPEQLIEAYQREHPDAIGLSGLLVKSAGQMAVTAGDLRDAGITAPLLVGGAALSERFTTTRIAPEYTGPVCYAKDAMSGLSLLNTLMDPAGRARLAAPAPPRANIVLPVPAPEVPMSTRRSRKVSADLPIPTPASLERFVRDVPQLQEVWSYLNLLMLYGHHLGFKGNFEKALAQRDPKALEMAQLVEDLQREAAEILHVRAVWQFFPAEPDGNSIHLFAADAPAGAIPLHSFHFERQRKEDGLCLADYVLPPRSVDERLVRDHLALLVVTAGAGVRERAEAARQAGRYVYSHGLQVLALETAEATAEWLHRRIREDWGFPDPPEMTMKDRHTSRYRGKRYAFGYPACPNLNDQAGIWKLLRPDEIGVHLTDGMMMEPEASTSALVFHHPACAYYSISDEAAGRAVPLGA